MTLRTRLVAAFVALAVGPTLLFGMWASRQSARAVEREAMRSVGIKADARRQALHALLRDRRTRLQRFLSTTRDVCPVDANTAAERACLGRALADFATFEGATAALLRRGTLTAAFGELPSTGALVPADHLRNPLASIDLQAQLLLDEARKSPIASTTVTAGVQRIRRAAGRMTRLVSDLLDAAAIENRTLSVDVRACEVASLLHETVECLESTAQQGAIRLTIDLAADVPALRCDRDRILQVLSNLVGNAIKFTRPGGTVTIGARRRAERVEISVTDDGIGVPAECIPRLFEPFWHTERRSGGGTGLGLFIARGLVVAHDGELHVESAPGHGTRFWFDVATVAQDEASEAGTCVRNEAHEPPQAATPLVPGGQPETTPGEQAPE